MIEVPDPEKMNRHVLAGHLDDLEFAIAAYIAAWGRHLPGVEGELEGTPTAVANMAMTVIRKNVLGSFVDNSYRHGWDDSKAQLLDSDESES